MNEKTKELTALMEAIGYLMSVESKNTGKSEYSSLVLKTLDHQAARIAELEAEVTRLREALRLICNAASDEQIRLDPTVQSENFAQRVNLMAHRALLGTFPPKDEHVRALALLGRRRDERW